MPSLAAVLQVNNRSISFPRTLNDALDIAKPRQAFFDHHIVSPSISPTTIIPLYSILPFTNNSSTKEIMAGGKGKSGGKSSGGKTGADGNKKQQSHSSKAGLQVSTIEALLLRVIPFERISLDVI